MLAFGLFLLAAGSMSELTIPLDQALALRDRGALLVDARSPSEFAEGTIPGAVNVPVLDDAQRAQVGTVYKQEGKAVARRLGIELVAPRIPAMMAAIEAALVGRRPPVVVFCWRGGMRSKALTAFLDLAGLPARQLLGGHKAFRSHVRSFLDAGEWGRLLVLRGLTGVGKTRLLLQMREQGVPAIDLEGLANHRGSAFGALGLAPQPTQKAFEALLWDALRQIPPQGWALAEGESRNIGRLYLPPRVHAALQVETSIWVDVPLEERVRITLADYPVGEELKASFVAPLRALRNRLGGETVERLLGLLAADAWAELVRALMVLYYDPLYQHSKPQRRIEVVGHPSETAIAALRQAIDAILAAPAPPLAVGEEP
jgi:tRNA 2-selenouridine synthase